MNPLYSQKRLDILQWKGQDKEVKEEPSEKPTLSVIETRICTQFEKQKLKQILETSE